MNKKQSSERPFFARLLEAPELQSIRGGNTTLQLNYNASYTAFQKNPNVDDAPIFVTLKAGSCGNDCDSPDPDGGDIIFVA